MDCKSYEKYPITTTVEQTASQEAFAVGSTSEHEASRWFWHRANEIELNVTYI